MEAEPKKKVKNVFKEGPIPSSFVGESIGKHQVKTQIGAHAIFLGQVRADEIDGKTVQAIEYTAHEEMANNALYEIREAAFEKYDLTCSHIYHSLGNVPAGEICLFVFTSSPHREEAYAANRFIVEELKAKAPIFGKELFEDDSHQWKENK